MVNTIFLAADQAPVPSPGAAQAPCRLWRPQQNITSFFKQATPKEAVEQAAEQIEADAAATEERNVAEAEAAAKKLPRKLLGLRRSGSTCCSSPSLRAPASRREFGGSPRSSLILPILRKRGVALRQTFVRALAYRFPTIHGALALTKPLTEFTVRLWFELGSYTVLLSNAWPGARHRGLEAGRRRSMRHAPGPPGSTGADHQDSP